MIVLITDISININSDNFLNASKVPILLTKNPNFPNLIGNDLDVDVYHNAND